MPNSNEQRALWFTIIFLAASAREGGAQAQQQAQGFALERFYPSAPGGGWFVMDDLDTRGGLGGAMALTSGYAMRPLRVTDGLQHVAAVSDKAFADFGFAVTYERWRLYLNLDVPLATSGQGGTVGNYRFTTASVDLGSNPDTLSDIRIGLDARLLGSRGGAFRLGAGGQFIVPNGNRAKFDTDGTTFLGAYYDTDGTYRAMVRVLFAGDVGLFTYAGQLGVHVRPLDDSPTPGSPQGSELLFGVAAGTRFSLGSSRNVLIVGPEIYGETAFRSFMGSTATGLEGLFTGRLETTGDDGPRLRVKLGTGPGINAHFGAPEWRIVVGLELLGNVISP